MLSWGIWEMTKRGRPLWPPHSPLKQVTRAHVRVALPPLEERDILISEGEGHQEDQNRGLAHLRPDDCLPCTSFCPTMFSHDFPLFTSLVEKRPDLTASLVLHLLIKSPMSHKTYIKYMCMLNLSFVHPIYRDPAAEPRWVVGQITLLPYTRVNFRAELL